MTGVRLGLRENLAQFSLLVVVNAFVGAMVGMERSILPPIAEQEFHLAAKTAVLSFIVVFGVTKALTNYLAGRLSDRFGRKHVLVAGWIVAAPVPFLLMWAPTWSWVLVANALLGVSQGLTWSTTVIMKIDLAGPKKRGLAMGLNEFAGYFAVAGSALATGFIAAHYGLRPEPFYLGVVFVAAGLLLSVLLVRETKHHVAHESKLHGELAAHDMPTQREIFWRTTLTDGISRASARRASSTTSTTAWRGVSSRSSSWPPDEPTTDGHARRRSTRRPGASGSSSPGRGPTGWGGSGSSPGMWVQAVGIGVVVLASGFAGFARGRCSASARRWSIRRCSRPSATSRIPRGGPRRSACTASGATSATQSARCSPASRPMRSACPAAMWVVAALTFASGLVGDFADAETLTRLGACQTKTLFILNDPP